MFAPLAVSTLALLAQADTGAQPAPVDDFKPAAGWKALGKNLWFDPVKKEVVLRANVCLREGPLEHLICLRNSKEHESILATEAAPRMIHAGLLLTGAEPGHPVRYDPEFAPPKGTGIAIELEWLDDGKAKTSDARKWIRDLAGNTLKTNWVFTGSAEFTDPLTKRKYYGADEGDLITVANFPTSLLDLPIESTANDAERAFEANTVAIPPKGTPVTVRLRRLPADPPRKAGP